MKFSVFQYLLVGSIGWGLGILVNYLADVLPHRRRFVKPECFTCKRQINTSIKDLLRWSIWPKKCPHCHSIRSIRNFIVECAFIILSLLFWLVPHPNLSFPYILILLLFFILVTVIDLEHRLILHPISIFGGIFGLIFGSRFHGLESTVLGGLAGYTFMLGFYLLGKVFVLLLSRWRGPIDEEALGYGDVNLGGIIGLLLGWPGIIGGIIITILLAGAASLVYVLIMVFLRRFRPNLVLPFGPYLIGSAFYLLILRETISSIASKL